MKENRDNIYIYLWEEFNTVYVGRTVSPKGRHYQHKHRESEKTEYQKEYRITHREEILAKKKEYREAHREELRLKAKKYREKKEK